jgi:hypothetical protein
LTSTQERIRAVVVDASPAGWTFQMGASRWEGWVGVEATADDGTGPGRLMIGVSTERGAQQVHPCRDPEFKSGLPCTESTLPDGSILSERALSDHNGIKTIEVVLTHPDGTGVNAESGNFTLTWPPTQVMTPEDKQNLLHVSRPSPTYTIDQLVAVVRAVDSVTASDTTVPPRPVSP